MKKYLSILLLAFTFLVPIKTYAQVQWYKTTSMAIKYVNDNGYWSDWSDWEKCTIAICINLNTDVITIYSNKTQYYKVVETGEPPQDKTGRQVLFYCIDGDGDKCTIRFRIENSNGNSQIYVDFANIMWVYNVYRTE